MIQGGVPLVSGGRTKKVGEENGSEVVVGKGAALARDSWTKEEGMVRR